MIETKFTKTAIGKIPHLELCTNNGIIRAPVQVRNPAGEKGRLPMPVRAHHDTAFVYALPGGGRYIA